MSTEQQKAITEDLLTLVVAGKIDEAYQKYVDLDGRHHNLFTPAGFAALKKGMKDNDAAFPDKRLTVKHVISEGDMAVVHSYLVLKPGTMEMVTFHLFRFANGKIVEMWDCGQVIEDKEINSDGP